jgi:hypothetical protein
MESQASTEQHGRHASDELIERAKPDNSQICKVCLNILAIYETPFETESTTELGLVSDLLASDCVHTRLIESAKSMWLPRLDFASQTLSISKSKNKTSAALQIHYERPNVQGVTTDRSFGLIAQNDKTENPGRVRMIDPAWVDVDLIRSWRTRCMQEHGTDCDEHKISILESSQPMWLIDVQKGCIVGTDDMKRSRTYIALSYTWGQAKNYQAMKSNFSHLQQDHALFTGEIADQIPRTIHDAIGVAKVLGEQFLWVDSLCIIQDDEETLRHELNRMHLIYANSFLCLVAKEGSDAEHGIRGIKGVSVRRSVNQVVMGLAGGERLASVNESWEPPVRVTDGYTSRAWTFQEYVFAKRRLVFGQGPLTWQCNRAAWYEDLHSHPLADAHYAKQDTWGQYRWMSMQIPSLQNLSDVIEVFNFKKLTYPEDIPRAFAGIQSFLNKFYQGGLLFGLPEFFFDIALFWLGDIDCKRRQGSRPLSDNPIENGLPSWSWMGWEGKVRFPTDCEFETIISIHGVGFTEPVTKWYTMESLDAEPRRRIDSQWYKYRTSPLGDVPDGWKRKDYSLGPPIAAGFAYRPKDLQTYTYEHISETEPRIYWYTLPSVSLKDSSDLKVQTQYLYCETSRAFFYATSDRLVDVLGHSKLQVIQDREGSIVGGLTLNPERNPSRDAENSRLRDNIPTNPNNNRIELVAIAKGWTVLFKKCGLNRNKSWSTDWIVPDRDDADDEDTRRWKEERAAKDDCYFVLWVSWESGVAYRQGTGIVLMDLWEKHREKELVKLVLG